MTTPNPWRTLGSRTVYRNTWLKRELLEETGLTAGDWTALGSIDNSNGATTDVAHLFLARNLSAGAPVPPRG
jgi:8-oxo-dGTP pyrophosphatase MutT (NUDIX family)